MARTRSTTAKRPGATNRVESLKSAVQYTHRDDFSMVIRPQMRLSIVDNLLIGIVPGIPVSKRQERLSAFVRLIYEPKERHR